MMNGSDAVGIVETIMIYVYFITSEASLFKYLSISHSFSHNVFLFTLYYKKTGYHGFFV